jgi:hypothetical protein
MLDRETVYSYIGELEGEFEKKKRKNERNNKEEKKKRDERTFLRLCVFPSCASAQRTGIKEIKIIPLA